MESYNANNAASVSGAAPKLKDLKSDFNIDNLIKKNVQVKPIKPKNNYRNGVLNLDTPMFPFVKHYLTLGYVSDGSGNMAGIRYLTGLDEYSKGMLNLKMHQLEEYHKRVYEIRSVVAYLTEYFESRKLDIDDPDFWTKTILRPNNNEFWSSKRVVLEPTGITLNLINPEDLITYYCIKGGGYDVISPSIDELGGHHYFYLDENRRSVELEAQSTHQRNKVLGYLYQMYSANKMSLLLSLLNIVDIKSGYSVVDGEQAYSLLSNWLVSGSPRVGKDTVLSVLLSVIDKNINYISVRAFVEKLIHRGRIIYRETENSYFSHDLSVSIGKDVNEIVSFLSSEGSKRDLLRLIEIYKNEYRLNPSDFEVYKTQNSVMSNHGEDDGSSQATRSDGENTESVGKNEIKRMPFQKKSK